MEEKTSARSRHLKLLQRSPSRRTVLKVGAATFASTAVFAPAELRADNLVIKVGHISPKTGPMAGFAEAQDWTLDGVRKALEPGLQIGDLQGRVHHEG
jgi:branched-chain amino acid transport system substrate-binding protein